MHNIVLPVAIFACFVILPAYVIGDASSTQDEEQYLDHHIEKINSHQVVSTLDRGIQPTTEYNTHIRQQRSVPRRRKKRKRRRNNKRKKKKRKRRRRKRPNKQKKSKRHRRTKHNNGLFHQDIIMYGHGQVAHRAHHSHHHSSYETTARGHDKKYRPRTHPKHVSSPHPSRPALHPHIEHPHANSPPHHHEQDQSRIEPHNSSVEKNDQHPTAHQTPPDKKEDEQKPQQQPKKPDQQQDHGKVDQNKANKASEIINTVISMVEIGALDPSCQMCAIELVESALFSELTPLKAFMNPSTLKRMKTLVDFIKGGKGQLLINEASSLLKNPAVKKVENTVTNGGQQAAKEVSKGGTQAVNTAANLAKNVFKFG